MTTLAHSELPLMRLPLPSTERAKAGQDTPPLTSEDGERFARGALVGVALSLLFWLLVVWVFLR